MTTYPLTITLEEFTEDTVNGVLDEIEAAIGNIRKFAGADAAHVEEVDIDDLLAEHHAVGVVWDIQHVKDQRPDLTDDQAWDVLQVCQRSWDRLGDPMLETIREVANNRYPPQRYFRPAKAGEVIASYGEGDERENLVDLLTDAMHWCEGLGEPFEEFATTARIHFDAETRFHQQEEV